MGCGEKSEADSRGGVITLLIVGAFPSFQIYTSTLRPMQLVNTVNTLYCIVI